MKLNINVNGAVISLESSSVKELVGFLKEFDGHQHEHASLQTSVIRLRNRGANKNGYHRWTDKDLKILARTAKKHGSRVTGLGRKAFMELNKRGDVRSRSAENTAVIADRVHAYIHHGQTQSMGRGMAERLAELGYGPKSVA